MIPGKLDQGPVCASRTCDEIASAIFAGVPLCDHHRRLMHVELTLPRATFVPKDGEPWFVYYITWPHKPDVVKIGATGSLATRLSGLRKDGHPPELLVAEPGTDGLEAARHKQFATFCLGHRSEYFHRRPPLDEHIEALRCAHPDWLAMVGRLPWWMNPHVKAASFSEVPRCGAPSVENGRPCLLMAGHGTDHPGIGHCKRHGGSTP